MRLRKDHRGQHQRAPYRPRKVMRMQAFQMERPHGSEVRQADRDWVCIYQEHEELLEVPVRLRECLLRLDLTAHHRGDRFLWLQERREQSEPSSPRWGTGRWDDEVRNQDRQEAQ